MDWKQRYIPRLGRQTRLQRKLHLAFGFFFLCPVAGLIFFGIRYNLMADEYVPYFFLGLLVFAWLGFSILKGLFERITAISASMAGNAPMAGEAHAGLRDAIPDELRAIVDSFQSIRDRFGQTARQLEKKIRGHLGAQGPLRAVLCDLRPGRDPATSPWSVRCC